MSSESEGYAPRKVWEAQPVQLAVTDRITVRNLQATVDAGVDVWGREKKQRALITVTLSLAKPFDSAARADALDSSTVHYGKLSKDVQACIEELSMLSHQGAAAMLGSIFYNIRTKTIADESLLASVELEIFFPKGSMFGEGAGYLLGQNLGSTSVYQQLHLRNVRVPCLIGVNANERLQKQPVVVNLWIDPVSYRRSDDYPKLENTVVETISNSSFETLESLSTTIVNHLRENFFTEEFDRLVKSGIRLRIEKPHAVPAADAPVIEIYRPLYT